jgi:hypothetical protein
MKRYKVDPITQPRDAGALSAIESLHFQTLLDNIAAERF